jgi:ubiquinone biosynthesis protein UbiJ
VIYAADAFITATIAGLSSILVGFLGWLGTRRSRKVDEAAQLITGYKRWADQLRVSEERCRDELDEVRADVAALRGEVEKLKANS